MSSTCTVRAKGDGDPVTDPTTGAVTYPDGEEHYSGPCRVRPANSRSTSTADAGGAVVFPFDYVISVPFAEADIVEGDVLTVDTSPDPSLVGVVVEVQKVDRGEHISARRLFCKDVA